MNLEHGSVPVDRSEGSTIVDTRSSLLSQVREGLSYFRQRLADQLRLKVAMALVVTHALVPMSYEAALLSALPETLTSSESFVYTTAQTRPVDVETPEEEAEAEEELPKYKVAKSSK